MSQGGPWRVRTPFQERADGLRSGYYAYLRKYARRAGLAGLKPHDLRHTAANSYHYRNTHSNSDTMADAHSNARSMVFFGGR